jgi:hypothetical protein
MERRWSARRIRTMERLAGSTRDVMTRMLGLEWVNDDTEYRAAIQSLASPGTLVMLPPKFRCTKCGCEEYQKRHGLQECAMCHGYGLAVGERRGQPANWCAVCRDDHTRSRG